MCILNLGDEVGGGVQGRDVHGSLSWGARVDYKEVVPFLDHGIVGGQNLSGDHGGTPEWPTLGLTPSSTATWREESAAGESS